MKWMLSAVSINRIVRKTNGFVDLGEIKEGNLLPRRKAVAGAAMEATNTRPLMQKVYHENCPGCKQEQRSDGHVGIPYREFFCIFVLTLCYVIPALSIYPYLYFLIRDLHIARREEDIGFYAGFVGSSFMFGRLFTSVFWGIVADQYGRKPVAIINIISVIVFNTLFGLGTNYWMAITSRTLLGLFSGLRVS